MGKEYVVACYGYSGSTRPVSSFEHGKDNDRNFELTAETILKMAKTSTPSIPTLPALRTWNYFEILEGVVTQVRAAGGADARIKQLHICCHAGTSMLSLAYNFDHGKRISKRAQKFNARATLDMNKNAQLAFEAFEEEDAWIAGAIGVFPRKKDGSEDHDSRRWKAKEALRAMFAADGYIHLWGCNPGGNHAEYGRLPEDNVKHDAVDTYLKRFELYNPYPSIAREMAIHLNVPVTAARLRNTAPPLTRAPDRPGGLQFWYNGLLGNKRTILPTETGTMAPEPRWLWPIRLSEWVTWGSSGSELPKVRLFDKQHDPAEINKLLSVDVGGVQVYGQPPPWFTKLYQRP